MTEGCASCPVARVLRERAEYLEERLARAEALLEPDQPHGPYEWALSRQQAILAHALTKGPQTRERLLAVLEHHCPSEDGRDGNHITVVIRNMRRKLEDFGWVIEGARSNNGMFRVPDEQRDLFARAFAGDGDPAHPSIVKPKPRPEAAS